MLGHIRNQVQDRLAGKLSQLDRGSHFMARVRVLLGLGLGCVGGQDSVGGLGFGGFLGRLGVLAGWASGRKETGWLGVRSARAH